MRLPHLGLLLCVASTHACIGSCFPLRTIELSGGGEERVPFVDEWDTVFEAPGSNFTLLKVGGRISSDNFANRGDIEVRYVEGSDQLRVEMQRFTVAGDLDEAEDNFARMSLWAYDLEVPEPPSEELAALACGLADSTRCHLRSYFDGLFQPSRDGVNFRVSLPSAWAGELILGTSDNLEDDIYPDRSDVRVEGLAGDLSVDMDSGRLDVRLDPQLPHYADCSDGAACEATGHGAACGCEQPSSIRARTGTGAAANMQIELVDPARWYSVRLENSSSDPACPLALDCSAFEGCELDASEPEVLRAELNFPGAPASPGGGIEISLLSEGCGLVDFVEGPEDYGQLVREEQRGLLTLVTGAGTGS